MTDLIGAPYNVPALERGNWADCEVAGRVQVGGWTEAAIPWPRRLKSGRAALIVTPELARAVHTESVEAICENWGVSAGTVWSWRKALGVGRATEGTRQLLRERTGVPEEAAARGRAAAQSPEGRARMAATLTGRQVSQATRDALLTAARRPKGEEWGERANAWMLAGKRAKRTD